MAQLMPLPLTVSCFSKIQIGFTFLVPAHTGSPGKKAVKRVCVCTVVDESKTRERNSEDAVGDSQSDRTSHDRSADVDSAERSTADDESDYDYLDPHDYVNQITIRFDVVDDYYQLDSATTGVAQRYTEQDHVSDVIYEGIC